MTPDEAAGEAAAECGWAAMPLDAKAAEEGLDDDEAATMLLR
jgi:hypothetical protein